jgi:hypothetical protein
MNQLSFMTSLRFVEIGICDCEQNPYPRLLPGFMSILRRKLVSVERISISLKLFGREDKILDVERKVGEWLRTYVKKKIEEIDEVFYVKLIWEAKRGEVLGWKKQSQKRLELNMHYASHLLRRWLASYV